MSYAASLPRLQIAKRRRRSRSGYGVPILLTSVVVFIGVWDNWEQLRYTPEQIAERHAVAAMLTHIKIFRVACPATSVDPTSWHALVARMGWALYPQAGPGCINPTVSLNYSDVVNFQVACPTTPFDSADQHRWASYATQHGWPPYPQAGAACVDP